MGDYLAALADVLSPPSSVATYDQRGCGASSCDGSFGIDAQIADLDAIRAHLGGSRIHLFGHSWGGLLAQLYAKAHPDRVASLVLCCSMANTGRRIASMESRGIAERVVGKPKRSRIAWVASGLLMQLPGRLGDRGFGHVMNQLLPHYVVRPDSVKVAIDVNHASKRAWRQTNRALETLDDDHLTALRLDAPVLIVYGEHDVIRETSGVLAERFPTATSVRIANAAHFPWLEEPEAFAEAVRGFYNKLSP
jgi:proline iminopeptidase